MRRKFASVASGPIYTVAVDSQGNTIDFFLSSTRDAPAAKRFLQKAFRSPGHPRPRVINVDGNPSYPKVIAELKDEGEVGASLPMSTGAVFKQHPGARPSIDQAASARESGLPLIRRRVANDSGD